MRTIQVPVGEIKTIHGPGVLVCSSIGSCVVVIVYDASARIAGMIRAILPAHFSDRPTERIAKFADTGIPELFRQVEEMGATRSHIRVALVGGAQFFRFGPKAGTSLDIGRRNGETAIRELAMLGIRPEAHDLGGSKGRNVTLELPSGIVKVKHIAGENKTLCTLSDTVAKAG